MEIVRGSIITLILCLIGSGVAQAPTSTYKRVKVRLTAYSPKQPRESNKNHRGQSVKDEDGVAVPKGLLPDGTIIRLPNGEYREVDDRIPRKSARKFDYRVVDVRYYQSINSKPKTRAVNKELAREFDMGWGYIEVKE